VRTAISACGCAGSADVKTSLLIVEADPQPRLPFAGGIAML
jgi:hypothetical protein